MIKKLKKNHLEFCGWHFSRQILFQTLAAAAVLTLECSAKRTPKMKKIGVTAIRDHSAIAASPMLRDGSQVQVRLPPPSPHPANSIAE